VVRIPGFSGRGANGTLSRAQARAYQLEGRSLTACLLVQIAGHFLFQKSTRHRETGDGLYSRFALAKGSQKKTSDK
jgi:hypothetical protein